MLGNPLARGIVILLVLFLVVGPILTTEAAPLELLLSADFTTTPLLGRFPLEVSFTDQSAGNPTNWTWYFGEMGFQEPWTAMTTSAPWSGRYGHAAVALPDGSIVLMGGLEANGVSKNDVWRSTDKGATWTQVTAAAPWSARDFHSAVVLPDGSIVLMGGYDHNTGHYKNDVWRSTDKGTTWTRMTAAAPWYDREDFSCVVLPDGSIVLMGGFVGTPQSDVWRSTDKGATWTRMTAAAPWGQRCSHTSVALPDGTIVLMGGIIEGDMRPRTNDVWKSTDKGATWTRVTAAAPWTGRSGSTSVVLPDGSIVLMGGMSQNWWEWQKNDVWRSTNKGATWTQVTASAPWVGRESHAGVVLPDGSIVILGGRDRDMQRRKDVWRWQTGNSTEQNPRLTYSQPGTYRVTLRTFNGSEARTVIKELQLSGTEVVVVASPASGGSTSGGGLYVQGSQVTVSASPNPGYTFSGWHIAGVLVSSEKDFTFTPAGESIEARFTLNTYGIKVTAVPSEGGSVQGAGTYNHGALVSLIATPNPGYTFLGWYEEEKLVSAQTDYRFSALKARELEARFVKNYAIGVTIAPTAGGTVTGSGTYPEGTVIELKATPAAGYRFVQWLEDGKEIGTQAKLSYTVAADTTIAAVFWPMDPAATEYKTNINTTDKAVELAFTNSMVTMFITGPDEITGGQIDVTRYNQDPQEGSIPVMVPAGIFLRLLRSDHFAGSTIRIEVSYNPQDLPLGVKADSLKLYRHTFNHNTNSWEWIELPLQGVNLEQNYVWAELTEFSTFGIFGEAPLGLPVTSGQFPAYYLLGLLILAAGYLLLKRRRAKLT